MWRLVVRPQVEDDLVEASLWYDKKQIGLGDQFLAEYVAAIYRILENPWLFASRWICRTDSVAKVTMTATAARNPSSSAIESCQNELRFRRRCSTKKPTPNRIAVHTNTLSRQPIQFGANIPFQNVQFSMLVQ